MSRSECHRAGLSSKEYGETFEQGHPDKVLVHSAEGVMLIEKKKWPILIIGENHAFNKQGETSETGKKQNQDAPRRVSDAKSYDT